MISGPVFELKLMHYSRFIIWSVIVAQFLFTTEKFDLVVEFELFNNCACKLGMILVTETQLITNTTLFFFLTVREGFYRNPQAP